jgi:hypothetical protein
VSILLHDRIRRISAIVVAALMFAILTPVRANASVIEVKRVVDSLANPWLAGLTEIPDGTDGVFPPVVDLHGALVVTFPNVEGEISCYFFAACTGGADGQPTSAPGEPGRTTYLPLAGIAGLVDGPYNYYQIGVFLSEPPVVGDVPPASLDFTDRHEFHVVRPGLRQPFFIGDGRTERGMLQRFVIPRHARWLYLGVGDQCGNPGIASCYGDNGGALLVTARLYGART